jgi:hypothetical protein
MAEFVNFATLVLVLEFESFAGMQGACGLDVSLADELATAHFDPTAAGYGIAMHLQLLIFRSTNGFFKNRRFESTSFHKGLQSTTTKNEKASAHTLVLPSLKF